MVLEIKQGVKLSQQLLITPQLQQAIKLLQLSRLELSEFISEQLAENPVLEEDSDEINGEREQTEEQAIAEHITSAADIVDSVAQEKSEVDWENLARAKEAVNKSSRDDNSSPNYENYLSRATSLTEHLATQIAELNFNVREQKIAALIVGNLDERGYLTGDLMDLAAQENFSRDEVVAVLDTVQRLEPSGVAARDLNECLLIQLRNANLRNGIVEKIVDRHLELLVTRNFQVIAKDLSIAVEEVIANVRIIAELEPDPGRQFASETVQYITPDVYVFKSGGKWVVSLNEEGLPRLKFNEHYRGMLKKKGKEKSYLGEKFRAAGWLIKSIHQRQNTIFRVTSCIVEKQKDFFDRGIEYLKPMVLRDIAEELELHESTISRVTTAKYAHTPRGIFELKYFFNSSVSGNKGTGVASETVKCRIERLVRNEDATRPLSDQAIVDRLEESSIHLARRTVAKYREQLGIPPSSKRKKFF